MRILALLLVTLLAAAATAAPLDLKSLGARLGVSPDDADRTELEAGIIAYNRGPAPRAYASIRTRFSSSATAAPTSLPVNFSSFSSSALAMTCVAPMAAP